MPLTTPAKYGVKDRRVTHAEFLEAVKKRTTDPVEFLGQVGHPKSEFLAKSEKDEIGVPQLPPHPLLADLYKIGF